MARPRDSQRQRVYNSERDLSERLTRYGGRLETIPEIQAWVDQINNSRWMKSYIKRHPFGLMHRQIVVKDGRGRVNANAEVYSFSKVARIKMPRWSRSRLVILHEMAHVYTPLFLPVHGPDFCATFLDLVGRWIGPEAKAELKAAFKERNVKFRRTQ